MERLPEIELQARGFASVCQPRLHMSLPPSQRLHFLETLPIAPFAFLLRILTMSRSKSHTSTQLTDPTDDICPVCKSNRYLNPSLTFLINPECYHRMCSTCVDRIFTSGPASCPMPFCTKTLRKRGFHKAFFADLKIEREVDVRRRVGEVFNKRQEEFDGLRNWNDYLEEVEGLVFDLVEGDVKTRVQAEERLRLFREKNAREIEANKQLNLEESEQQKYREKSERAALNARRLAALQAENDEKADIAQSRMNALERLANSDASEDAEAILRKAQKIVLKKSSARRNMMESAPSLSKSTSAGLDDGFTFRGLKAKKVVEAEKPYDPFGGLSFVPTRYVVREEYDHEPIRHAKRDVAHMGGGYSLQEYYERTLFEAFSGLGVFVEDEVLERDGGAAGNGSGERDGTPWSEGVSDVGRRTGGLRIENDDVF